MDNNVLKKECIGNRDCLVQHLQCKGFSKGLDQEIKQFVTYTNTYLANLEANRISTISFSNSNGASIEFNNSLDNFNRIMIKSLKLIEENILPNEHKEEIRQTIGNILESVMKTLHESESMQPEGMASFADKVKLRAYKRHSTLPYISNLH